MDADLKKIAAQLHKIRHWEIKLGSYDEAYVAINGMDGQPVKEIDMTIRHQEHIDSINADLNYIGSGIGFDPNYYSFSDKGLKTATEVISDNSDTYRTKVHHQIIIKDVLYDLIKSVCFLEGIETKSINIVFDDSIIEDKNAEIERGLKCCYPTK